MSKTITPSNNNSSKTKTTTTTTSSRKMETITPQKRQELIARAAYLRAQARNFEGNNDQHDWFMAEKEIDSKYSVK